MGFWKFIGDVLDTAIGPYPVKGSVVRSSDDRFYGIYDGYVIITTAPWGTKTVSTRSRNIWFAIW